MAILESLGSAALAAAPSLLGQYNAARSADDANKAARETSRDNILLQREFAQHGIRWKVEDAKKAGIHPLAALGASTHSFSPVSVGHEPDRSADFNVAMGQDISRAIQATRTAQERRLAELQLSNAQADLDGKIIDNQIRASQLQKMTSPAGVGPALPNANDFSTIPGQGNSVQVSPSKVFASQSPGSGIQAGTITSMQYSREANGNVSVVPSEQGKERNEDDFIAESLWHLRNRVSPPAPSAWDIKLPPEAIKRGADHWKWDPLSQQFRPARRVKAFGGIHKQFVD